MLLLVGLVLFSRGSTIFTFHTEHSMNTGLARIQIEHLKYRFRTSDIYIVLPRRRWLLWPDYDVEAEKLALSPVVNLLYYDTPRKQRPSEQHGYLLTRVFGSGIIDHFLTMGAVIIIDGDIFPMHMSPVPDSRFLWSCLPQFRPSLEYCWPGLVIITRQSKKFINWSTVSWVPGNGGDTGAPTHALFSVARPVPIRSQNCSFGHPALVSLKKFTVRDKDDARVQCLRTAWGPFFHVQSATSTWRFKDPSINQQKVAILEQYRPWDSKGDTLEEGV